MSRATRQEVLIRSMTEGLCLTLEKSLQGQPRQKPKLQAIAAAMQDLEALWQTQPLQLTWREGQRVKAIIEKFDAEQEQNPAYTSSESLTAFCLALLDHLGRMKQGKPVAGVLWRLTEKIEQLYDTFDRQVKKLDLLVAGAEMADKLLRVEM